MLPKMRDYQKLVPSDVRLLVEGKENGVDKQLLVFQTPFGYRRAAELLYPEGDGSCAAPSRQP